MKKTLLSLFLATSATLGLHAQPITDTVSTGAGSANQVWYDLETGAEATAPAMEWDIAFEASSTGSSILLNSAGGAQLWRYPGSVSDWSTLDTTGMGNWLELHNSDTSWAYGAFSRHQSSDFDLGWGIYNMATHIVEGDSLFLIKLTNGEYRKLFIEKLASGTYTFRYGSLDNSIDETQTLSKANFSGKNFGYYSLVNGNVLDREPLATEWDLLFTKYTAFVPIPYAVTGILQNADVTVAEVHPVPNPQTYSNYHSLDFRSEINTIGWDWKSYDFNSGSYVLEDSLVYFVKKDEGNVWRLVLKEFGGSTDGNFIFSKEQMGTTALGNPATPALLKAYPNPATNQVNIVLDVLAEANLQLLDGQGRQVYSRQLSGRGLRTSAIPVSHLPQGLYILRVQAGQQVLTQKVQVQ